MTSLTDKLNQEMDPTRLGLNLEELARQDKATKTNLILYVDDGKLTVASVLTAVLNLLSVAVERSAELCCNIA